MNGTKTFAMMIAITAASAPAAAFAQSYDHNYYNGGSRSDQGVIAWVDGTHVRLQDGRNIFLHNGTVINPRGTNLQPGQRISVTGNRGGHGAINANEIDVYGNGEHRHRHDDDNDNHGDGH